MATRRSTSKPRSPARRARTTHDNGEDRFTPERVRGKPEIAHEDGGPRSWFLEQVEASYLRMMPKGATAAMPAGAAASTFRSVLRPGDDESTLATVSKSVWLDRLLEYKRRKAAAVAAPAAVAVAPPAPVVPGGRNWSPLGPTMVLQGQTVGEEPIGGRVAGIAIAPGGQIIYAASACGGVFRSDNGGTSWRSLMDGFDVDPTNFAATSLACGAIAIDPADPNRIYVGTGEGDTHQIFSARIVNALPAYRGIGPIRSDDGGDTWISETTVVGSPALAGEAFFALAVDPANRDNVIGATTAGLYQRVSSTSSAFAWRQRRTGVHCSVVAARSGSTTRFFAAEWGVGVFHSTDGSSWTATGTGFPTVGVGRIALAVRATDPNLVYAFVCNANGAVLGVYRLDGVGSNWQKIANLPDVIPTDNGSGQGDYDLTIAIDPNNADLIYLGGSYADVDPFPGSVWRCPIQTTSAGFKCDNPQSIGTHAHADVHVLMLSPGNSDELWCGCDGGMFLNRAPRTVGQFAGMNSGLSCLCSNFIGQHPTDPGVIFTGLQDNGTARTGGGPAWTHVNYGDGGYCLVHWNDPSRVLSFVNGRVFRSTTGGQTHNDWVQVWNFGWATMTQPIVSAPFNPNSPSDADWVAVGAGDRVFISRNFATSWPTSMRLQIPGGASMGSVFALAFASTSRLFIGTTRGGVFRADRSGSTWSVVRLDDAPAGPLPLNSLIADVAVDWSDSTLSSVYVAFGGMGDQRHVWRFDGTSWQARSGSGVAGQLLDVEHNALVVDPLNPANVYVGADIGVWHSPDQGQTWEPLQNGLPDAPVFDLQLHATQRLLRAATHGRGIYEIPLT